MKLGGRLMLEMTQVTTRTASATGPSGRLDGTTLAPTGGPLAGRAGQAGGAGYENG